MISFILYQNLKKKSMLWRLVLSGKIKKFTKEKARGNSRAKTVQNG